MTAAQTKMVEDNMRLVHFMAKKRPDIDHHEALSAGMDGLMEAVKRYDPKRGIPFGTYAGLRIKWKISQVKTALRAKRRGGHIEKISFQSENLYGPTMAETIADESSKTADDESKLADEIEQLRGALAQLHPRSLEIICLRFGLDGSEPVTLDQIGQKFRLTRERIRQIEAEALHKMQWIRRRQEGLLSVDMKKVRGWKVLDRGRKKSG